MPLLTEDARLQGLGPIELESISLTPSEAAELAGIDGDIAEARLSQLLGRPAYRFARVFGQTTTVFADSGEIFERASQAQALRAVAAFVDQPVAAVQFVDTVREADQWTLTEARNLPLERFDIDDGLGTRVYFSLEDGDVKLVTNRRNRTLAWIGTIPHWFYFTPLRSNQPVWYWSIVWLSAAGSVLALLGLILAVTQFRRSRPFRWSASVRYRGWMRWHYYTGALFGLFALTWVFSGLLSMEPFAWTNATGLTLPRNDLTGGALELDRYAIGDPAVVAAIGGQAAEVKLLRIQTDPYYAVATIAPGQSPVSRLIDASTLATRSESFSIESIVAALEATVTEANIREYTLLEQYDAYYYARDGDAPLPVLRVKFDDAADTWFYFDLATSRELGSVHRLSRLERWLFNGLHSLDFSFWYSRRPLWDIGLIVLSLGALATSSIGLYLGCRRLVGRAESRVSKAGA
jgi:hypothetical protein